MAYYPCNYGSNLSAAELVSLNQTYRNRNLGTIDKNNIENFISEHEISKGTFKDIYPGDYVTIMDGVYNAIWLIAGMELHYGKGDTPSKINTISLIPKSPLFNAQMNSSNTNAGGYIGSNMDKTTLVAVANNLKQALGDHLINRRVQLTNSTTSNTWVSRYCTLLSEVQIYGQKVYGTNSCTGEADSILPIFYHGRYNTVLTLSSRVWLRGLVSSTGFCFAITDGSANNYGASNSYGVLPLIDIG